MPQSKCKSCHVDCHEDCACDAIVFRICPVMTEVEGGDPEFSGLRLAWEYSGQTLKVGQIPTPVANAATSGMLRFEVRSVNIRESPKAKCNLKETLLYTASGAKTKESRACKDESSSTAADFTLADMGAGRYVFCVSVWDGIRLLYICYVCYTHRDTPATSTSSPSPDPPYTPSPTSPPSTSPTSPTSPTSTTSPSSPSSPSSPDPDPPVTDPPGTSGSGDDPAKPCECHITQYTTLLSDPNDYCFPGNTFRVYVFSALTLTPGCRCAELRNCNGFWHINGQMAGAGTNTADAILELPCPAYGGCVDITTTWTGVQGLVTGKTCTTTECFFPPYD